MFIIWFLWRNRQIKNPFASSEIRWFSDHRELIRELYYSLPLKGPGRKEPDRTDLYLRAGLVNTGIKVREGNHEIKVKSGPDEKLDIGIVQHWVKWSHEGTDNILDIIEGQHLGEWIAVEKTRQLKTYGITSKNTVLPGAETVGEGCGVEYTEIHIPAKDIMRYTLGFEAFSQTGRMRENLYSVLTNLESGLQGCRGLESCGYPGYLAKLFGR